MSGPDEEGDDEGAPETDPQLVELSRGKTLEEKKSLLLEVIEQVANAQAKEMYQVAEYVAHKRVDVANGSFGTSYEQIEAMVKVFYFSIFHPFCPFSLFFFQQSSSQPLKGGT